MHFVSLPIEILRTRPALVFWLAALMQAAIWVAVPSLFYATPPADLTDILSVSPQWRKLVPLVPPLPYALAEIAFRLGGFFGVYLLAQACVVTTLWAVFALGRAALDARHAVLGTLLMTGIYFMTVPTPDFSAAILAMPLWALALLHLWRAAIEGRARFWPLLGLDLVLLSAVTYLAPLMIALLIAFVLLHPLTRQRLLNPYAAATGVLILAALALSGYWLKASSHIALAGIPDPRHIDLIEQNLQSLGRWLGLLLIGHAGIAVMAVAACFTLRAPTREPVVIRRPATQDIAASFIAYFAIVPALALIIAAVLGGYAGALHFSPFVVLSGLAAVLAAGEAIALRRQRAAILTWFVFLVAPPVIAVMTALALPWTAVADPRVALPARDIGTFFADNFARRTGQKLQIVAGDPALATLISVGASSRPLVLGERTGNLPALVSREELADKGGIIVWRTTDSAGTPPADIRTAFPDLVPEVPRVFERRVEGRLPQLRIGWAMIRPKAQTPPAPQP